MQSSWLRTFEHELKRRNSRNERRRRAREQAQSLESSGAEYLLENSKLLLASIPQRRIPVGKDKENGVEYHQAAGEKSSYFGSNVSRHKMKVCGRRALAGWKSGWGAGAEDRHTLT